IVTGDPQIHQLGRLLAADLGGLARGGSSAGPTPSPGAELATDLGADVRRPVVRQRAVTLADGRVALVAPDLGERRRGALAFGWRLDDLDDLGLAQRSPGDRGHADRGRPDRERELASSLGRIVGQ